MGRRKVRKELRNKPYPTVSKQATIVRERIEDLVLTLEDDEKDLKSEIFKALKSLQNDLNDSIQEGRPGEGVNKSLEATLNVVDAEDVSVDKGQDVVGVQIKGFERLEFKIKNDFDVALRRMILSWAVENCSSWTVDNPGGAGSEINSFFENGDLTELKGICAVVKTIRSEPRTDGRVRGVRALLQLPLIVEVVEVAGKDTKVFKILNTAKGIVGYVDKNSKIYDLEGPPQVSRRIKVCFVSSHQDFTMTYEGENNISEVRKVIYKEWRKRYSEQEESTMARGRRCPKSPERRESRKVQEHIYVWEENMTRFCEERLEAMKLFKVLRHQHSCEVSEIVDVFDFSDTVYVCHASMTTIDEYFMLLAASAASRNGPEEAYAWCKLKGNTLEKDDIIPSVGCSIRASISEKSHRAVLGCGWNGLPGALSPHLSGSLDIDIASAKQEKIGDFMSHAECNAMLVNRHDMSRATVYVTREPCIDCAKLLCQLGIQRVVYFYGAKNNRRRPGSDFLEKNNVEVYPLCRTLEEREVFIHHRAGEFLGRFLRDSGRLPVSSK